MYHVSAQGVDERMINVHYYIIIHAKPHTSGACVFSCNLPSALLAE